MGGPNAAQHDNWNGPSGRHWVEHEAQYEAQLACYVAPLLDAARLRQDSRVLDVGCGFGAMTLAAARATTGDVVGIDLSRPLIERARQRAASGGIENVRFVEGDAQVDVLEGPFGSVISRFGVMFFADPVAAFTNLAGASAPGARLAFVCWQPYERNAWMRVPGEAMSAIVPLGEIGQPGAPGPYSLGDPDVVGDVLRQAGYVDVELTANHDPVLVAGGGTLDDAVVFLRGSGLGRSAFDKADAETQPRLLDALREALAPFATPDGVLLDGAAWLVSATRR